MPWVFNDSKGNIKESTVTTLGRAMAQLVSSGTVNHTGSATWVQLGSNAGWSVNYDTNSIADPSTGKLTAPVAGRYRVTATLHWSSASTSGVRGVQVNKNTTAGNTNVLCEDAKLPMTGITNDQTVTEVVSLNAGDYVTVLGYQNSGGTLQMNTGYQCTFTLERVDEATTSQVVVPSGAQVLICSQVLTSPQGIFDTNTLLGGNIPQTYNHLKMLLVARSSLASNNDGLYLRFNNDSGANYDQEGFYGQGGTYSGTTLSNGQTQTFVGYPPGTSVQANAAAVYEYTVPLYTGTTFFKNVKYSGGWNGSTAASSIATAGVGGWRNTGAITRIQIGMGVFGANNFVTGSAFHLYGIL